jgi:hypothetical protein
MYYQGSLQATLPPTVMQPGFPPTTNTQESWTKSSVLITVFITELKKVKEKDDQEPELFSSGRSQWSWRLDPGRGLRCGVVRVHKDKCGLHTLRQTNWN